MKTLRISALAAVCTLLSIPSSQATLLVYEGYDGYAAGLLNGQTPTNTTGFSSAAITGGGTTTVNSFNSTGLTFSNLLVSGGSGRFHSANSGTNAQSYIGYTYNGPTVTGTLYTAYLTNLEALQSTGSIVSMRVNATSATSSTTSYFVSMADSQNGTAAGNQYDASSGTTSGTTTLALNTTYVIIGRYTNVGTALSATTKGSGTTFVLTEAQFDFFKAGGFTDAELDSATIGVAPSNVFSRVTDPDVTTSVHSSYPSGFNNLVSGNGIQFAVGNAGSGVPQTAKYDEIRYGTSLNDVLPLNDTPEPESVPVSLTVTNAIATEPTAAVPSVGKVTLTRLDGSTQQVTVNLSVAGTAINGADYLTLPTSLTLPANTNSVSLEVRPIGDRRVESDETVIITAIPSSGYTVGAQNSATITIQDGPPIVAPTKLINNLAADIPQRLVVFGTSLTQSGEWSTQLKSALDSVYPGKTTLINTTGSGRNSKWGIANVKTQVIDKNPDTVFIEFAVNDAVIRNGYQDLITPAQARINLNAIIDAILGAHPNCEIILQVMSPVVNPAGGDAATARPNLALCQQTYRDVGQERGLLVIDHMPAWQSLLDQGTAAYLALVTDGLHPPGSGYNAYVTPVILREIGAARNTASDSVMLNATNHRTAEPATTGGMSRSTRITVSRNGFTDSPLVVPLTYGGTATPGTDYTSLPTSVTIPVGASSASIEMIPLSDSNVEGVETFTVSIGAGITVSSPGKASLIIEDRPFDQWRKSQFSPADLNDPLISGDLADPDQDGFANLLEFFTGHAPKSRDMEIVTRGVETVGSSSYLTLSYNRIPANGVTGIPQTSVNLTDWRDGPMFVQETILSDDGLIQTIKARSLTPITGDGKEFIRLKTTRNP